MEITPDYAANPIKNNIFLTLPEGTFRVSTQTKKSKLIEFFDDLYTYPPKFKVKWNSLDDLNEDLFMSYNYRALEQDFSFMSVMTDFFRKNGQITSEAYSPNSFINGYLNKIVSTKFYAKQTRPIQDSLQNIPIYTILNGQGNIVLANSTDQINATATNTNSIMYDFCGDFDPLAEKTSNLGFFFMSRKDAELYLQEIARSDTEGTSMFGLSIHCFGLDSAYRILREYHPGIDFKIIPDLDEVQSLLTKKIHGSDVLFADEQQQLRIRRRSTNATLLNSLPIPFSSFLKQAEYFKGTPIYIVKINDTQRDFFLENCSNLANVIDSSYGRLTQYISFITGLGSNSIMQSSLTSQNYAKSTTTYVFFEKNAASEFCKQFKRRVENYNGSRSSQLKTIIRKPTILISNLEDFLELWEDKIAKVEKNKSETTNINSSTTLFFDTKAIYMVPPSDSIGELEQLLQQSKRSPLQNFKQFLNFKTRCLNGFLKTILSTN